MLEILAKQREYFNTNQTLNLHFRREQLKNLRKVILEKKENLYAAFKEDLNKCEYDVVTTELGMAIQEIDYLIKNLYRLADDRVSGASAINYPAKCFEVFEPYGNVLVVAPWNYPFQLTMVPVFGAIAGGNTVVVKPSRNTPNVTKVIKDILEIFPDEYVYVVDKDEEIEELFDNKFDFIFYTGSGKVGRELMAKQAQYLTPMTLELGGKNPCIVSKSANLNFAAKRIAWGKFLNAGQTCVAPDYILVDKKVKHQFLKKLEVEINRFYYNNGELTSNFVKIINQKAFDRLFNLIDPSKVVVGGRTKGLVIEPTVMDNVTFNDEIMQDEIFGPLLPVIEYDTIDEVVEKLRALPKPLALYYFGRKQKEGARVLKQCPSGGGCINDVIMHITEHNLPFGGVGESGFGTYHGAETFYAFVHKKSVLKKSSLFDIEKKYPPYDEKKLAFAKKIFGLKEPKEKNNKEEKLETVKPENEVDELATENVDIKDVAIENDIMNENTETPEQETIAIGDMPEDIDNLSAEEVETFDERPVLLGEETTADDATETPVEDVEESSVDEETETDDYSVATEEENAEIARMEAEIANLENEFEEGDADEDFASDDNLTDEEIAEEDAENSYEDIDDIDDAGEQADTLYGQETMNEIVPEPIVMNLEEPENGEEIFDEISQSVLSEIDDIDAEPADMPADEETATPAPSVEMPEIEDVENAYAEEPAQPVRPNIISLPTIVDIDDIDEADDDNIVDDDTNADAEQVMDVIEEVAKQDVEEPVEEEIAPVAPVQPVVAEEPAVKEEPVEEVAKKPAKKTTAKKTTTTKKSTTAKKSTTKSTTKTATKKSTSKSSTTKTTAKKTTTAKKKPELKAEVVEEVAEVVEAKPKKTEKSSSKISMEEFPFLEALGANTTPVEGSEEDASDAFLKSLDNMVSHNIKNDDE